MEATTVLPSKTAGIDPTTSEAGLVKIVAQSANTASSRFGWPWFSVCQSFGFTRSIVECVCPERWVATQTSSSWPGAP